MHLRQTFPLLLATCILPVLFNSALSAEARFQDRIARNIENSSSIPVRGNVHPFATAEHDRGRVSESFPMRHVTMVFRPTDAQQEALHTLLEEQQDAASPNYHRWLSPNEFADRFGLSANDINKIVSWLQGQGFTIDSVARDRRSVSFSGRAGQIETAFGTSIHAYEVDGTTFYANSSDPSVPEALSDVVLGFRSLSNFALKPRVRKRSINTATAPRFTSSVSGNHFVSPSDFATIYGLNGPRASGLDGAGQKIAVVGQTDILLTDIRAFRNAAGLAANDPEVILIPGSADPGVINDDLAEADMDIEWAGAVAPGAHIIYVNSTDVMASLQYAITQNLASIVSISYGDCERNYSRQETSILAALGQQANAQGITILAPAGDNGAADCDWVGNTAIATRGLSVDMPASLPYVTALGGSEFVEASASWANTNSSSNGSVLSYLPEAVWNDTAIENVLTAGGGGRSINFAKPAWQSGNGVPNDGVRDVPDISLSASADHDGFLVCSNGSCKNGFRDSDNSLFVVGGTSLSAPSFAGIVALLNQHAGSAQGNINPILYSLAATAPLAFHDIATGGNQVPCRIGTADCSSGSIGYSAGQGYDMASGIGSVDVGNLIASWPMAATTTPTSGTSPGSTTTTGTSTTPTSTPIPAPQPISDVEQGSIHAGYAIITPDSSSQAPTATVTFGLLSNGIVQSQAGVTPIPPINDGSLFIDVAPAIGRNVGVALANPGSTAATVTLTLKDKDGNAAGSAVTISLAPQQQLSRFVNELFSATTLGQQFVGSLRVQSSSSLGVLGLRFSGTEFSTMPVGVNTAGTATTAIVLPQFAMGGGWATQIALVNSSTATMSGRVDLFDTSGQPMALKLNGSAQSTFSYSIAAGGALILAPRDANGQTPF
jgi:hypothetical protein